MASIPEKCAGATGPRADATGPRADATGRCADATGRCADATGPRGHPLGARPVLDAATRVARGGVVASRGALRAGVRVDRRSPARTVNHPIGPAAPKKTSRPRAHAMHRSRVRDVAAPLQRSRRIHPRAQRKFVRLDGPHGLVGARPRFAAPCANRTRATSRASLCLTCRPKPQENRGNPVQRGRAFDAAWARRRTGRCTNCIEGNGRSNAEGANHRKIG